MRALLLLLPLLLISCGELSASAQNCETTATASTQQIITESLILDIDGDGVINAYDAQPFNSNKTVVGNGTEEHPFMIYNTYQLTAYIGYDHTGAELSDSAYTNNSYLYEHTPDSFYQVVD